MPLRPLDQWLSDYRGGVDSSAALPESIPATPVASPDPVIQPKKSVDEWLSDLRSGKTPTIGAPPSTINKPITDQPTSKIGGIVKNLPGTLKEIGLDLFGVHAKVAAGLVKGATLGAVDAEQGTVGVPFTADRKQITVPLPTALKIMGVSPEIADNPDIGTGMGLAKAVSMGAEAVGVPAKIAEHPIAQSIVSMAASPETAGGLAAWSGISKAVGVMGKAAGMTPEAVLAKAAVAKFTASVPESFAQFIGASLKTAGRISQETVTGALFGLGHVRGPDEDPMVNALMGAAFGGGGAAGLEGVGVLGKFFRGHKMRQLFDLQVEISNLLYESGALSEEAAQHQAARVVTNSIYKKGGIGEMSVGDIKEAQATVRETFEKIMARKKGPTPEAPKSPVDTTATPEAPTPVKSEPAPVPSTEIVPVAESLKPTPEGSLPQPVPAVEPIAAAPAIAPEVAAIPPKIEAAAPSAEIAQTPEPLPEQKGVPVRSGEDINKALETYRKTGEFPAAAEAAQEKPTTMSAGEATKAGMILPSEPKTLPPKEGVPYALERQWGDPISGKKIYDVFGDTPQHKGTFYENPPAGVPVVEGIYSPMSRPPQGKLGEVTSGGTATGQELQPTEQALPGREGTETGSAGLPSNVFPKPTIPSLESISQHPGYIKITDDALNVVNRYVKEKGITNVPEHYGKKIWQELHDELGRIKMAPAAERMAIAKEILGKYPNAEDDFAKLTAKMYIDANEDYFPIFVEKRTNVPLQPLSEAPTGTILNEEPPNANTQRSEISKTQAQEAHARGEGVGSAGSGGGEALAAKQIANVPIASEGGNAPQDLNQGGDQAPIVGKQPGAEPPIAGDKSLGGQETSPPTDQPGTPSSGVAEAPSQLHRNNVRSIIDTDYTAPEKTPEETLTGGGGGGSLASKGGFEEDFSKKPAKVPVFEGEVHTEMGGFEHIKPMEMPEIVELATELGQGKFPEISKRMGPNTRGLFNPATMQIRLRPEIFTNPKMAAQVLAHELGHLIDYLPDGVMGRGNIIGRLKALTRFLRNQFGEETITNKELRAELIAVSEWWRPYDKTRASQGFRAYRDSPAELYADAISVLFNAPAELESRAPKFYEKFFENLDAKPQVKEEFFDLMDRLNRPDDVVLQHRQEHMEESFAKAADIWQQKRAENELGRKEIWQRLRQLVDNVFQPVINRQNAAEANGVKFNDAANPRYLVDEMGFADNVNRKMLREIQEQVRDITKDLVTDKQLGTIMFLERVIADRSGMANPGGQTPETAQKGLDYLKSTLGPEAWAKAQTAIHNFHDLVFDIVERGVKNGVIGKQVFEEKIRPNKYAYAAFRPLEHVDKWVSPGIKAQVGTLKDIENPFVTTILKMISLNRVNILQETKNSVKDMLQKHFSKEISKAKPVIRDGVRVGWKKEDGMDHLEILEDGKSVVYNVDPAIARSFRDFNNHELKLAAHVLRTFTGNKFFRGAWITYNLGFGAYTNPIRDFGRSFKLLPEPPGFDLPGKPIRTALNLALEYFRNAPTAIRRANGIDDALIKEMEDMMALAPNFVDVAMNPGDDQVVHEMKKRGIIPEDAKPSTAKQKAMKPLIQLSQAIQWIGSVWETLGKVAGYQYRKRITGETGKELAYNTRNYIGTPNWRRQGSFTPITNEIFMFSNINKEDWKANYEHATNPKTRSGYWWKTLYANVVPKLMMRAAVLAGGLAGATAGEKALKELFDRIPENDKTNYICIPLGKYSGGDYGWKTVYLRIPHDDFGRTISGMFWKITGAAMDKNAEGWHDLFNVVDNNLPGINQGMKMLGMWGQYLTGQNPYDSFRGRGVMSDDEFKAGGWPALKKMVEWNISQTGQIKIATYNNSTKSTTERVLEASPGLNAALKISDYGLKERETTAASGPGRIDARERIEKKKVKEDLLQRLRTGDLTAAKELGLAVTTGKLSVQELKPLIEQAGMSEFQTRIKAMPLDQAMAVYNAMGDEEKKAIAPIIGKRMAGAIDRGNIDQLKKVFRK